MKLKDVISKVQQYPVITIKAGDVVLANRIKTKDIGSNENIATYITDLLKNHANPNVKIEIELRKSNGQNASLYAETVYLDQDDMPTFEIQTKPLFVAPAPGLNGTDAIYQIQLQFLEKQLRDAEERIKKLTRENDEYYSQNRKLQVAVDTIEAQKNMEMTLNGVEQSKTLAGVLEKVVDSGILETILDRIGSSKKVEAAGETSIANLIGDLISHLTLEHQQYILGIVKVYALAEMQYAKDLFNQINQQQTQEKVA